MEIREVMVSRPVFYYKSVCGILKYVWVTFVSVIKIQWIKYGYETVGKG